MKGLFNYDNPIWRFLGKFWDIIILHILWFICCIPIITIGASTTALYYVTLKLARDDDGYTIRSFFSSFKQNFKQATIIWLIFLFSGIILAVDLWFVLTANVVPVGTPRMVLTSIFIGLMLIWLIMITYVFPILARFYGTVKQTIQNALLIAIRYFLYTIGILAIDAGILYLTFTSFPFLIMFGYPLIAFANSYFFDRLFKKYIPEEDMDALREVRPLFLDDGVVSESK